MAPFRLAHFSDIHFTLSPFAQLPESLAGKRLASAASYIFGGRRTRFHHAGLRIATLLDDIDHAGVDHALCTGDVTSTSLDAEFDGLAKVFGGRLGAPERYTVLPGNHDRYVPDAVRRRSFEKCVGALCGDGFPFSKALGPQIRIVAVDAARPTSLIDSSGLCGEEQRAALATLLAQDTHSATIVALHYGLLRWRGNLDRPRHGLRDAPGLLDLLNESPARIALVVHGHMHGAFTVPGGRFPIVCAGSATDLHVDCGYCIYEIDPESLAVRVERRHWNRTSERYEPADPQALNDAVQQRRGATLDRRRLR